MENWQTFLVHTDATVRDAIAAIERGTAGIALVVREGKRLVGTVTDGDVRRAILRGVPLSGNVQELLRRDPDSPYAEPITAPVGTPADELVTLMHLKKINQIPLLDNAGRVVGLVTLSELTRRKELDVPAVIMAGGFGTRLYPLTKDIPKPMLPVGEKPLLEHIIKGLSSHGIRDIWLTVHYRSAQIRDYFGEGRKWNIQIHYINEEEPRGTAGALGLLPKPFDTAFLLMNGDLLTRLNYRALYQFHRDTEAAMTVCVKEHQVNVPYGVVEAQDGLVYGLSEKPISRFHINAGIYMLTPELLRYIPQGNAYNVTDLIRTLIANGQKVVSFPVQGYWQDIGQLPDYEKARRDFAEGRFA
jgi:dTDP-glucose pyrophosphorylase/CBS domain-containing protein